MWKKIGFITAITIMIHPMSMSQESAPPEGGPQKKLGVVATAHLDTQWRWTVKNSIEEYIPATFRDNFKLMDKYPDYVFSFEGAFRYMLLKEYYPEEYERLKKYIESGQWRVAGSWVDGVDVNIPSFESLVRHTLYGNGYYKKEFGKSSRDVFLPDCFGFGYALPSIASHCGLKSFSTQKLTWGSAYGIPFDIGIWEGVDGSSLYAAFRPGSYVGEITDDLSRDTSWLATTQRQGDSSGLYGGYMYFGTGDTGGAPDSNSVEWLSRSLKSDGPLQVSSIASDDLVNMIESTPNLNLPRYKGELLMKRHGVGCYTSQAAMKRWNRQNEQLADATERASVIASLLGGAEYPREALRNTWVRFLWHGFHDDLTGTSIPEAYVYSWNDEILCLNQLASMLENAVAATTPALDTRVKGIPLVVYNPLGVEREDIVEASVATPGKKIENAAVFGPDGKPTPSQIVTSTDGSLTVVFVAKAPSVGYAVYDLREIADEKQITKIQTEAAKAKPSYTSPTISSSGMENHRYILKLDNNGDVSSIFDKLVGKELLSAPIQLQLIFDKPKQWPAWEIQYEDIIAPPRAIVSGPAEIRIVENGAARAALEVTRKTDKAAYRTVIRLAAGMAGERVEFENLIDWYERETLLKAAFEFTTANSNVTYDLGLGAIDRGVNKPELYEVPGHQWADMTSPDGSFGVAVLNDCRYGWDHPTIGTLRLSLIHTPGVFDNWSWVGDQSSQDNGRHRLMYAVQGHQGDWRTGGVVAQAANLNQPLRVFQTSGHSGTLGKRFSLVAVDGDEHGSVFINALKMAEETDEIIVRVRETQGKEVKDAKIRFAQPVISAREVFGSEESKGDAVIKNGALVTSLSPYQPKAFAVRITPRKEKTLTQPKCQPLLLVHNLDGISTDLDRKDGNIDGLGNSISGDLLPDKIVHLGVTFMLGPKTAGAVNVLSCQGQTINLPAGDYNRLFVLASSTGGPSVGTFTVDAQTYQIGIQDYAQPLGQWNSRLTSGLFVEAQDEIAPAYINRAPVAWYGTHRHNGAGENEAYQYTYLYLLTLELPAVAKTLTLPNDERIKIFAATVAHSFNDPIRVNQPLYDEENTALARIQASRRTFIDSAQVSLSSPTPGAAIHFTLDGSEPNKSSAAYAGSIFVNSTTTVKARVFAEGVEDSHVTSMHFTKQVPREPIKAGKVVAGLTCSYYEGEWKKLPNFDSLKAIQEVVVDTVAIPAFARPEDYALKFVGYVEISRDGMYEFFIDSDDGSALFISDSLLVDNDGIHGSGEISGEIALKAGLHPIKAVMFQAKGYEGLSVSMQGPDFSKQIISKEKLFYEVRKK